MVDQTRAFKEKFISFLFLLILLACVVLIIGVIIWFSPPRGSLRLNISDINKPWTSHHVFGNEAAASTVPPVCASNAKNSSEMAFYTYENGTKTKFLIKGMGYSPTPIGMEPTDYYIPQYRYLYTKDIPVIAAMGVNVIRLWEWNFQADHSEFLELLEQYNLRVLVPFLFTKQNYPDLGNEQDVRNILLDFSTLVSKTINSSMVMGYLIGNELNIEYDGFMDQLFPIVNQLAVIVKDQDAAFGRECPHLVMLPLSNSNFGELVSQYNKFVNFTNWALQAYNPELSIVLDDYLNRTRDRPLPLLLTEFGADAYNYPVNTTNSTVFQEYYYGTHPLFNATGDVRQANTLVRMWEAISAYSEKGVIGGGIVMEFVDEWWKGNEPDMIDIGCPDTNIDEHSACGQQSDSTFIHEEYLGVFSQSNTSIQNGEYCISPRMAYYNLSVHWNGSVTDTSNTGDLCRYYVGIFDPPFIYVEILIMILFFLTVIFCSFIIKNIGLCRKELNENFKLDEQTPLIAVAIKRIDEKTEEGIMSDVLEAFQRVLQNNSNVQFEINEDPSEFIIPPKYEPMKGRLTKQIMDYLDQNQTRDTAIKNCYLRTLEGYILWSGKRVNMSNLGLSNEVMLDRLALWSVVYSEAGTIAHCPNMLFAVYHHLQGVVKLYGLELSQFLENTFRYYCTQIDKNQFSFDDVNFNGLQRQPKNPIRQVRAIFKWTPFIRFAEIADDVKLDNRVTSSYARNYVDAVPMRSCFNFRRNWITALFTLGFNLTWLLRLDLWMMFSSWYLQPTTHITDYTEFIKYLTISDAALLLVSSASQLFIWRSHYEVRHGLVLIWRILLTFFAIYCYIYPEAYYIYLSIATWLISEVYFNIMRLMTTHTEGHITSKMKIGDIFSSFYEWVLRLLCPILSLFLGELLFFYVLIPSFDGVNQDLCNCPLDGFINSPEQTYICSVPAQIACYGGFILVWLSSIIVSIIFLYASYISLMLLIGIVVAKRQSTATFVTWDDLSSSKWNEVEEYGIKFFKDDYERIWSKFIDSLISDWVISPEEGSLLRMMDFDRPPAAFEARRRVLSFANSWYSIATSGVLEGLPSQITYTKLVQYMPSFTTLIPVYNETIVYDTQFLRSHSQDQPVSNFEYLVNTYPVEWSNFCVELFSNATKSFRGKPVHKIITSCFQSGDYSEMWDLYVTVQPGEKETKEERIAKWEWRIRVWTSCHGQTLSRTLRGLANIRYGLSILDSNQARVKRKFQVIVSYQTFAGMSPKGKEELRDLQNILGFDIVYPANVNSEQGSFNSCYERDPSTRISAASEMLTLPKEKEPPVIITVERPSGFPIGEGKAENQMQALPFAQGAVFQALDMNQYFSLENAFFIPFALYSHFGKFDDDNIIPKFRILGFPEYTYSRPLGAVGEYMGLAEFAFVTIIQRVLSSINVRLHYGHPDYFDGYWAYYRGGPSKSTKVVNVNEDVFAGYEVTQRGEKIGYVEYFQGQKGRESGFNAATVFLTKLAQGAAQQVLSKDVYVINETLPVLERFSLFFGSLGFYVITYFMVFSIFCYLFSLTFFAIAGVSYHQLGLVGSAIAVPWIIQVGFIQMFPVMIELIIEDGFWNGFVHLMIHMPFMLLFFLFQIKTTAYHFQYGLTMGRGGYKSTGRGFELARSTLKQMLQRYTKSHFMGALMLLFGVLLYFLITQEQFLTAIIRMWSIELILLSWLLAPVVFNPFPNSLGLSKDIVECLRWIQTPFPIKYKPSNYANKIWATKDSPEERLLKNLQEEHAETSWEFSFWTQLFEESLISTTSKTNSKMGTFSFFVDMTLTFGQWVIFILLPVYGMIALALIKIWSVSTLPIIILFVAFLFLYLMTQEILTGRSRGVIAGVLIVTLIFCLVFWVFSIRTISYLDLILSLFLDLVVIYFIDAVFRGAAYFIVSRFIRGRTIKGASKADNFEVREKVLCHALFIRDVMRFVSQAPKAFPLILTLILYLAQLLMCWLASTLMSILYNTRVTHRWRNFELYPDDISSGIEARIKANESVIPKMKKTETLSNYVGIEVTQHDFASLQGIEWLTDNIINSVIYRYRLVEGPSGDWLFINCEIAKYHIEAQKCNKFCNLRYRYLMIPVCRTDNRTTNTFWSLMICDLENSKYCHFDSSENSRNENLANNIANQMKLSKEIVPGEWAQELDYNCGIRVIQIVKLFNHLTKIMEIHNFNGILVELKKLLSNRYGKADDDRREIEASLHSNLEQEIEKKKEYNEKKGIVEQEQLKLLQQQQLQSLEINRSQLQSIAIQQQGPISIIYRLQEKLCTTRANVLIAVKDKNIPLAQIKGKVEELSRDLNQNRGGVNIIDENSDILTIISEEVEILLQIFE